MLDRETRWFSAMASGIVISFCRMGNDETQASRKGKTVIFSIKASRFASDIFVSGAGVATDMIEVDDRAFATRNDTQTYLPCKNAFPFSLAVS